MIRHRSPKSPAVHHRSVVKTFLTATALLTSLVATDFASAEETGAPALAAAKLTEVRVPGTTAMTAAAVDLTRWGYTEREFYADGVAFRYRGAVLGALATAEAIDGNWPYRTRVLVRAPEKSKFNGTLVVEWANVTAGLDVDFAFAESHDYLLREGYAVAVVSAQRVGVDRLKDWSPQRYGTLTTTVPNEDPKDGTPIDTCGPAPVCPGDALSWDVMAQVSKALKDNTGADAPLPGMKVEKVVALGESQSAFRLSIYYNTIQPIHRFFDGFVFLDLATQLRSDQPVPAVSVNSESTATLFPPTTTSDYTRTWAVAGASHSSLYGATYVDAMVVRDKAFMGPNGPLSFTETFASQNCRLAPMFSTVDSGLVLNAALESVNTWIRTGKAAAPSRVFERDAAGALRRDASGAVEGGIRLAQFAAPTAHIELNGPSLFCVLGGHHADFSAAQLKSRYRTHSDYVGKVRTVMEDAVKAGWVLPYDRDAAVRAAEASTVAR